MKSGDVDMEFFTVVDEDNFDMVGMCGVGLFYWKHYVDKNTEYH